jgi:hypothetical protein
VNIINCTFISPPIGFGFPHIGRIEERGERFVGERISLLFTLYSLLFSSSGVCGAFISARKLI